MNDQQFKTYLESQALWRREEAQKKSEAEYLSDLVSNMVKADGGNLDEFRRWSTRVRSNAALLQCNTATIQLMLRTTLGPLKDEMDRYILEFVKLNPGKSRVDVPCMELLEYLKRSFLPRNDLEHVRESMELLRQASGESLRVFNRKFRDLSETAYTTEHRNADQEKLLIRMYLKSLHSKETARAVLRASPTSLQEAMNTAMDNYEVEDALQRLGHRQEEPMDTSALLSRPVPRPPSMDTLSRQFNKMSSKIAKLEAQLYQGNPRRRPIGPKGTPSKTAEGKPICYFCDTPGHIARYCPQKGAKNTPMDVSPVLSPVESDQGNE